jgi:hypothetical protein
VINITDRVAPRAWPHSLHNHLSNQRDGTSSECDVELTALSIVALICTRTVTEICPTQCHQCLIPQVNNRCAYLRSAMLVCVSSRLKHALSTRHCRHNCKPCSACRTNKCNLDETETVCGMSQ